MATVEWAADLPGAEIRRRSPEQPGIVTRLSGSDGHGASPLAGLSSTATGIRTHPGRVADCPRLQTLLLIGVSDGGRGCPPLLFLGRARAQTVIEAVPRFRPGRNPVVSSEWSRHKRRHRRTF